MTLPTTLIQRLNGLNVEAYNDKYLENLCQNIIDTFLDESKSGKFICLYNNPILVECDNNDLVSIMGSIIIRAASTNIEPEVLKEALVGKNQEGNRACFAVFKAYSVNILCGYLLPYRLGPIQKANSRALKNDRMEISPTCGH
jgi:hypothetical protein